MLGAEKVEAMKTRLRSLPSRERFVFPLGVAPSHYRKAAVLIDFWREADDLFVVLTKRARALRSHAGMVSFRVVSWRTERRCFDHLAITKRVLNPCWEPGDGLNDRVPSGEPEVR